MYLIKNKRILNLGFRTIKHQLLSIKLVFVEIHMGYFLTKLNLPLVLQFFIHSFINNNCKHLFK